MKLSVVLPLIVAVCIAMLGLIKLRQKEHEKETRRHKFQEIKDRVSTDVLTEIRNENASIMNKLVENNKGINELEQQVNTLQETDKKKKEEAASCQSNQKQEADKQAATETGSNNFKAEASKEKENWEKELASLKEEIAARSKACNFLKKETDITKKLCAQVSEAPKQEEPKPVATQKR